MNKNLFDIPLAECLRPGSYQELVGQKHLLGAHQPLAQALQTGYPHSMILWGPPGSGKTTIASLFAKHSTLHFQSLSAVNSGLKEVRDVIDQALTKREQQQKTVLLIDEIHRFNKAQQDIFLPFVEQGTLILIGATTENPSFEINRALLSRCHVYVLEPLTENDLLSIIERALDYLQKAMQPLTIDFQKSTRKQLIQMTAPDARQILNRLELIIKNASIQNHFLKIDEQLLQQVLQKPLALFDKKGDVFYEQISALHKAIRGSNPDAALYWLARMLAGNHDPLYIARRLVRVASEDIGNADPKALEITLNAWDVQKRLGHPEGELALAQAVVYLSVAPKSNAVYKAFQKAQHDAQSWSHEPVPLHLRNAPTPLLKTLDYGTHYRYDHDEPEAFSTGQRYFPDRMEERVYYHPTPRGLEAKISEKLKLLREKTSKK